jgi:hypothetical protein
MSRKKSSPQVQPADAVRERLEHLYVRRTAVINLIQSLEAYRACSRRKPNSGLPYRISLPGDSFGRIEA